MDCRTLCHLAGERSEGLMSKPEPNYVRNAVVQNVHDGDTLHALVDLGYHVTFTWEFRLRGIDAEELEKPGGHEARDYLISLIGPNENVVIHSFKDPEEKYGRWLADIFLPDGTNLCQKMLDDGWALPYSGRGPKPIHKWPHEMKGGDPMGGRVG
jgi:endonuclease YncB( thermonuclease family)